MIANPSCADVLAGGKVFLLGGYFGHLLGVDAAGLMCQNGARGTPQAPLLLYRSDELPEISFLLGETATPLRLADQDMLRPFRAVILGAGPTPATIALRDPISQRGLTADPDGVSLRARADLVNDWEGFTPIAYDGPITADLRRRLDVLDAIITSLRARDATALLTNPAFPHHGAALETLLVLADAPTAEQICARLMAAIPEHSPGWAAHLTDEPWFASAAFALRHRLPAPHRVGPDYDFLGIGHDFSAFTQTSPGHRFLRHARRAVTPRRTLALVATARDEGFRILEWVAHHRAIGVEHIFLYTNNLTDGSEALLEALSKAGIITWFDNSPKPDAGPMNLQRKAYGHAFGILAATLDFEWTLVVDLDEFVVPAPIWDNDLRPILRSQNPVRADAVAFQWRAFLPGGALCRDDAPSGMRFTRASGNPLVKTAFRTNRFAFSDAHNPHEYRDEIRRFITGDGSIMSAERHYAPTLTRNAVVCHYALPSLEEYVWKFARGENDGSGVLHEKRFRYNTHGVIANYVAGFPVDQGEEDLRYAAIAPHLETELTWLRRLPGVARAEQRIAEIFRAQVTSLVRQSVVVVQADERLSTEDRAAWAALVAAWERARG